MVVDLVVAMTIALRPFLLEECQSRCEDRLFMIKYNIYSLMTGINKGQLLF